MSTTRLIFFGAAVIATALVATPAVTAADAAADAKAPPTAAWRAKMQELFKTLSELMPDIASEQRFNDKANQGRIDKNAKKLSELAHSLNPAKAPDADPSIKMIAGLLSDETAHAYRELKRGHREYARDVLRGVTGYCIACHSRGEQAPRFFGKGDSSFLSKLTPMERAEMLAAGRQFDEALDAFEKIIDDPKASKERQVEWERAVRYALALSIRVGKDPDRAISIVDRAVASPGVPQFFKEDALQWKALLKGWKDEPGRIAQTEEGLYAEAMRLIGMAHAAQKYPADRSADVFYLRATSQLHELLRIAPDGKRAPEALLMLGVCYEILRDLGIWNLHDLYYVACIRKEPHSEIARSCFHRYEESVYAGYTGSGGTFVPDDVQKRLDELEREANLTGQKLE